MTGEEPGRDRDAPAGHARREGPLDLSVRQWLVARFDRWLEESFGHEQAPEGLAPEIVEELEREERAGGSATTADSRDLYGLWSALTGLTGEIRLQGRAFKDLSDRVTPVVDLGAVMEASRLSYEEAAAHARDATRVATESAARRERDTAQEERRRAQREMIDILLDMRDRLERGLAASRACGRAAAPQGLSAWLGTLLGRSPQPRSPDALEALASGYVLCLERLGEVLERCGVREIECLGRAFDPHSMDALEVKQTAERPDGAVLEVHRAGHMWNGEVFRSARVTVSRSGSQARSSVPAQGAASG